MHVIVYLRWALTRVCIMLLIVDYPCSRKRQTGDDDSFLHFCSGGRDVVTALRPLTAAAVA